MSRFNRFQYNAIGYVRRATEDLAAVYAARKMPRLLRPDGWRIDEVERRALNDLDGLVWC